MNATIKVSNPARGMFAAMTEDGEFVVFELLGTDNLEVGDVVSHGDFHALGAEDYRIETKSITVSVYVQNVVANLQQARGQCFLH
jgi:hypothetical protein